VILALQIAGAIVLLLLDVLGKQVLVEAVGVSSLSAGVLMLGTGETRPLVRIILMV